MKTNNDVGTTTKPRRKPAKTQPSKEYISHLIAENSQLTAETIHLHNQVKHRDYAIIVVSVFLFTFVGLFIHSSSDYAKYRNDIACRKDSMQITNYKLQDKIHDLKAQTKIMAARISLTADSVKKNLMSLYALRRVAVPIVLRDTFNRRFTDSTYGKNIEAQNRILWNVHVMDSAMLTGYDQVMHDRDSIDALKDSMYNNVIAANVAQSKEMDTLNKRLRAGRRFSRFKSGMYAIFAAALTYKIFK